MVAAAQTSSLPLTLGRLMTRSSIYNRHEARRARTLAKKDDPRAPMIRVLSGLPVFSIVFKPYEPRARLPRSAAVQSETEDSNIFTAYATPVIETMQPESRSSLPTVFLAAGLGGGVAELFCGNRSQSISPFSAARSQRSVLRHVPVMQDGGLAFMHGKLTVSNRQAMVSTPSLLRSAASTSALLGTKVAIERTLRDTASAPLVTVAAASTAGFLHAVWKTAWNRTTMFSREMVPVTGYFSVYEAGKYILNQDVSNTNQSKLSIALAGSLAGMAKTVLYETYPVAKNPAFVAAPTPNLTMTALRVAPFHAVLFLCYETVLSTMKL